MTDPTQDIYKILDEVGLTPGNLLANRIPMARLVVVMRGEIAKKLTDYIKERETSQKEET